MAEKKFGMVVDLRRCIGCHACRVACKSENNVPLGVFRSWVKDMEKGIYPNVSRHYLPRLCNHCENAPCVKVCPVGASYHSEDGVVRIDYEKCIGCKYCIAACPYDSRFINPVRKTAEKCDFCYKRITEGYKPACASTCVGGARIFGNLNDPQSEISKVLAGNSVQVLKPEQNTRPQVYYIQPDMDIMGANLKKLAGGE